MLRIVVTLTLKNLANVGRFTLKH